MLGNVSTGDARAVVIKGNYAFVADYVNSTTAVDITNPAAPVVVSHITDETLGGYLQDIVLSGNFTLAADVKFVNGIPITDVTNPTALIAREILNFPQRDDNGMGIAVDGSYAYLATEHNNLTKFGASGDSRLYIGQYLALVDNKGVPPTASITFPASGATVVEGAVLPITVAASDDIAVAAVNFVVNGNIVFTATAPPYQYNYTVPIGAKTVALGANAVDLGGNVGTAAAVTLNVIPDPGTTAQGQVRDQKAVPVPGATVTCLGVTGVSASDGTFSLPKVPTASGAISCIATIVSAGQTLSGSSVAVVPVLAGVTNVGNIVVTNGAPIAFVAGSSFADLGGVFDSIVVPTLPPVESFTPAGAGFVFTGKYMKIGVNSQGTFNYGGVGLQFDPTGSGSAFKPDVITPGTPRDVFGVRFDSGGSSFFAYGGSNNYPNDGNVALVSFATYSDSTIFAARSVTQYGPLQVISVTTLRQNDRYVSVDVTLVNTGGNSIDNLLFSRSADFDVEVPLNGYTNIFNQNKSPLGGTIIGACALYVPECYGLGTAAPFSVADGLTFADADPDVFRNQNPNGAEGDYSASLVFQVNTIAPGTSVHLTSKR
jgi:hypothetical protein